MALGNYVVAYKSEDGEEFIDEVRAYSKEQAYFIASESLPSNYEIFYIEQTCRACSV